MKKIRGGYYACYCYNGVIGGEPTNIVAYDPTDDPQSNQNTYSYAAWLCQQQGSALYTCNH